MKIDSKGFTLIELLVVIAIIGVLSSIVLGSLNSARAKGADAAIKTDLANVRAQAEIQYGNVGHYGDQFTPAAPCPGSGVGSSLFANNVLANQITHAKDAGGGYTSCHSIGTPTATTWAVAVQLKADNTKAYCSDSSGKAKIMDNGATPYTQNDLNNDLAGGLCGN